MSDLGANNNIMSPYSQTVITERERVNLTIIQVDFPLGKRKRDVNDEEKSLPAKIQRKSLILCNIIKRKRYDMRDRLELYKASLSPFQCYTINGTSSAPSNSRAH
jgi:hypothetical protein